MQTVKDTMPLREHVAAARAAGARIGFVPTMGNLHAGHLALVRRSLQATDFTVTSIFVNPFQFGEGEDFESYPRTLDRDARALREMGNDLLFVPEARCVYPHGPQPATIVDVPGMGSVLCGEHRPRFFRGVCTVVNILLNIVQPQVAYFGEKDYQQLLIVKRMVHDLQMPIDIVGVPTVREADGLAMSSRNRYLDAAERPRARALHDTLCNVRDRLLAGDRAFARLEHDAMRTLVASGFKPDYVAVRCSEDLGAPGIDGVHLTILGAAWMGRARLIDNVLVSLHG